MGKAENKLGVDDTWATSQELLAGIAPLGPIGLDPCSHPKSIVCSRQAVLLPQWKYARRPDGGYEVPLRELAVHERQVPAHADAVIYGNGLELPWDGHDLVYVNPPYSELGLWLAKAAREGDRTLVLAPIRSGNKEWAPANTADVRCDLPRQTFLGAKVHAPFHLCLLWWGCPLLGDFVLSKLGHTTIHRRHLDPLWARGNGYVAGETPRFRLAA